MLAGIGYHGHSSAFRTFYSGRLRMDITAIAALLLCWQGLLMAHDTEVCGKTPLVDTLGSRIIGGRDAIPGAWPWQASLQYFIFGYGYQHRCGGSLIDNTWVVTAAHCVVQRVNPKFWRVVLGITSISRRTATRKISAITEIYVHEKFDDLTLDNDVALMQLAHSIAYTDYIQPICLATQELVVDSSVSCFITGWGTTAPGGKMSDILQEAQINIISTSLCNRREWYDGIVSENMICAGYEFGGIDSCQGDSGGPLVCYIAERESFYQLGITSFGYGCAETHHPGIYCRVMNYGDWLVTQMANATSNTAGIMYDNTGTTMLYLISTIHIPIWLNNV